MIEVAQVLAYENNRLRAFHFGPLLAKQAATVGRNNRFPYAVFLIPMPYADRYRRA